ncbi:MAG: ABC transporter ATP-binding protein [Clostridia bacterium]|nr:ABC transporter ATP-binding protein [Clostridia bacterium]
MIEVKSVTKKFGDFTAVDGISFTVENSSIYGLIGYNGAGKTTLLKTASGMYCPDSGKVLLDGENAYDNNENRTGLFYIPDDMYFMSNSTVEGMAKFYNGMYESFDVKLFERILSIFCLDKKARLRSFSKGMKRQAEIAFALASRPKFMLLDEVFDGLDPQKKEICKTLFLEYMAESECSVIISSHSLSELANLCDHVGLINGKRMSLDCSVDDIPHNNKKYRLLLSQPVKKEVFESLPIKSLEIKDNAVFFTVIGEENLEKVRKTIALLPIASMDEIPMTLEEVFLSEMEDKSYDLQQIFS